jgi:hypothetical protein
MVPPSSHPECTAVNPVVHRITFTSAYDSHEHINHQERRQHVEAAILRSLALIGYPATAGQISAYGYAQGGIGRDERNEALQRLVAAGQVVVGEQPGKCRGPLRIHTVYSLARPGGGP